MRDLIHAPFSRFAAAMEMELHVHQCIIILEDKSRRCELLAADFDPTSRQH